jgi:glucose/arabinose dehydrogenase
MSTTRFAITLVLAFTLRASAQLPTDTKSDLGPGVPTNFRVRPGYRVTRALAPQAIREARFLQFSTDGKTLYVSSRREGEIYALRDPDSNGVYQKVTTFVKDKASVQGLDIHNGWLYFQIPRDGSIERARDTNDDGVADQIEPVVASKTLPRPGGHPYNALLVTDKEIYVSASDPTNYTEDIESPTKKIYIFDLDGKNQRLFCSGVRNCEKLRFRPGTTEIWGFDHGSDNFGKNYGEATAKEQPITDLNPPEELNKFVQDGFYGHPYIMGTGVPRPEFATRSDIVQLASQTIQPEWNVHAHWAVCGWTFLSGDYFPGHKGDIFFASHGSWNSVKPVGSCVDRVMFDQLTGRPCGQMTIVDCSGEGTNRRNRPARPVDCCEAPDGTVLFSSDEPTGLYRISKSDSAASR